MLADAILWTRCATEALQRQAAGNSRALRVLADAAVLRVETVSAALRGQRHAQSHVSAAACADSLAADYVARGVVVQSSGPSPAKTSAAPHRPATPILPPDNVAMQTALRASKGSALAASARHKSPHLGNACSTSNKQHLSQQQILGLRALLAAAACHRDVAAALVASGAEGPACFEWGQQLRHYWDAETQELKVGGRR